MFKKYYIYIKDELKKPDNDDDIFCRIMKFILSVCFVLLFFIIFCLVLINLIEHLFIEPKDRISCKKANVLLSRNIDCIIIQSEIPMLFIKFLILFTDSIFLMVNYKEKNYFNLKFNISHIFLYMYLLYNYELNIINNLVVISNVVAIILLFIPENIKKIREKIIIIEDNLEAQYQEIEHKKHEDDN